MTRKKLLEKQIIEVAKYKKAFFNRAWGGFLLLILSVINVAGALTFVFSWSDAHEKYADPGDGMPGLIIGGAIFAVTSLVVLALANPAYKFYRHFKYWLNADRDVEARVSQESVTDVEYPLKWDERHSTFQELDTVPTALPYAGNSFGFSGGIWAVSVYGIGAIVAGIIVSDALKAHDQNALTASIIFLIAFVALVVIQFILLMLSSFAIRSQQIDIIEAQVYPLPRKDEINGKIFYQFSYGRLIALLPLIAYLWISIERLRGDVSALELALIIGGGFAIGLIIVIFVLKNTATVPLMISRTKSDRLDTAPSVRITAKTTAGTIEFIPKTKRKKSLTINRADVQAMRFVSNGQMVSTKMLAIIGKDDVLLIISSKKMIEQTLAWWQD